MKSQDCLTYCIFRGFFHHSTWHKIFHLRLHRIHLPSTVSAHRSSHLPSIQHVCLVFLSVISTSFCVGSFHFLPLSISVCSCPFSFVFAWSCHIFPCIYRKIVRALGYAYIGILLVHVAVRWCDGATCDQQTIIISCNFSISNIFFATMFNDFLLFSKLLFLFMQTNPSLKKYT